MPVGVTATGPCPELLKAGPATVTEGIGMGASVRRTRPLQELVEVFCRSVDLRLLLVIVRHTDVQTVLETGEHLLPHCPVHPAVHHGVDSERRVRHPRHHRQGRHVGRGVPTDDVRDCDDEVGSPKSHVCHHDQ